MQGVLKLREQSQHKRKENSAIKTATLFRNLNCPYLPALIVFNSLPWIWVVLSVPAVKIKIPTKNRDFHFVKRRAIVFEGTTGLEINKKIHSITKICLVLSAV